MNEISRALDGTKIGIVCLTPENLTEPWILYEAGALTKTVDDETRLCTYLVGGLNPSDVQQPLGMFQATRSEKEDTRLLVHTINNAIGENPVPTNRLDELFDLAWPRLEEQLKNLPDIKKLVKIHRPVDEMVAEILNIVRKPRFRPLSMTDFSAYSEETDSMGSTGYGATLLTSAASPFPSQIPVATGILKSNKE
jgi:hypothetical protein